MFAADIATTDVVNWVTIVVPIVGAIWALLKVTIGDHLKRQDVKLQDIERLAATANEKADLAVESAEKAREEAAEGRKELRSHMAWEQTPRWRRWRQQEPSWGNA